uniref:Uncharacterized protein n=1 Tax=Octactis speculum TaxID=3111310 RepID=A0A7S2GF66_9STRA|mmetsp:Transcript_43803/g.59847  ORF Transcript_43803/g.59847 Transcript_43803/m.59847 type:complete len:108 (+) Transcript_43803:2245-2568(+)
MPEGEAHDENVFTVPQYRTNTNQVLNARWWNSYGFLNAAAYKCTRFTYGWKRHLSLLISPPPPPENIFSFPYQVTDPQVAFPWFSWTQDAFCCSMLRKQRKSKTTQT